MVERKPPIISAVLDPETGNVVTLFHPRRDHFQLNSNNGVIEPITAHGRVTERVLRFNQWENIGRVICNVWSSTILVDVE
jgi:hypothetical protein